jgi:hypothetical protein
LYALGAQGSSMEAMCDCVAAELLVKLQHRMAANTCGGVLSDSDGVDQSIQTEARYDVPVAIAPPYAKQPKPVRMTQPELKSEEEISTRVLKSEMYSRVLITDIKPPAAAHSCPMHRTVDWEKKQSRIDTFPDNIDKAPPKLDWSSLG